ncbi:aldo/keto reductase [Candidatus Latescibacterota bacterium]
MSNRREFLRKAAAGSVSVMTGLTASGLYPRRIFAEESTKFKRVAYRQLGSTGFKVSELGFGCMNMRNPELVHAAIDAGVNYLDTAWVYMKGRNEEIIGQVMKDRRKEVFLTTKAITKDAGQLREQMETSLKRLQTDQVDLMLFHSINSREQVLNEDYIKVFEKAKKDGVCRFVGISTHSNQAEVLDAMVESKFWEAVLVGYNYFSPKNIGPAIEKARKAGIAIIAMKNLLNPATRPWKELDDIRTGGTKNITKSQALIKWVLDNPYVDTTVPGMTSFEHLAENVAIMGMPMTFGERRDLYRFGERIKHHYCCGVAGCTGCKNKCPKGVAVNDINRCLMYASGYNNPALAQENYMELPESSRIEICSDCDECAVKCVNGLNLTQNIKRAKELFA